MLTNRELERIVTPKQAPNISRCKINCLPRWGTPRWIQYKNIDHGSSRTRFCVVLRGTLVDNAWAMVCEFGPGSI